MEDVTFAWRQDVDDGALEALHAEAFERPPGSYAWSAQLHGHSLGWVTAHDAHGLVGFVNVPWDGGVHAWIQDTIVAKRRRRDGIATRLVAMATNQARAAGCEWLHVDFDADLRSFYIEACGFVPSEAGLIEL